MPLPTKRILTVSIRTAVDTSPTLSSIGTWTDDLVGGVIVRKYGEYVERLPPGTEMPPKGSEWRGFKPYAGGEPSGTAEYYRYGLEDYRRMEAFGRGEWSMIGLWAEAEVILVRNVVQKLHSGGVWNIESDGSDDHIRDLEREELAELRSQLEAAGFHAEEIDTAFARMTRRPA